ncbi:MAG: hypothetical protein ABJG47_01145 [Ekhidna sp.]
MKKVMILVVLVALGAAATSCQDEAYNDVEETVIENAPPVTDDEEGEEPAPGQIA